MASSKVIGFVFMALLVLDFAFAARSSPKLQSETGAIDQATGGDDPSGASAQGSTAGGAGGEGEDNMNNNDNNNDNLNKNNNNNINNNVNNNNNNNNNVNNNKNNNDNDNDNANKKTEDISEPTGVSMLDKIHVGGPNGMGKGGQRRV